MINREWIENEETSVADIEDGRRVKRNEEKKEKGRNEEWRKNIKTK